MKWLLNTVYATLLLVLSPVIAWRSARHGRYRRGWAQKLFGALPCSSTDKRTVWFHAVSVGEVLQLQKVVAAFRQETNDEFHVVVTTSTDTGFELASSRFDGCTVTWFPLDFSWAVSNALTRIQPHLVVLMELELWPNFLTSCRKHNVPTALINARMSDRSFRGYSRIRPLIRSVFQQFAAVGTQSDEYANRLKQLGCQANAVQVTGSVKFDGVLTDRNNECTRTLKQLLGIGEDQQVLIAGSTQDPEEEAALQTWLSLRDDYPELRLILVPRHRERFDAVADLVKSHQLPLCRRSLLSDSPNADAGAIILLDTIGELGACWGLADIAFVGGSFGARGGQNMLEPAAYGAAVMFGPKTRNFRDIVALLMTADAAIELSTPDDMQAQVRRLLEQPDQRRALGQSAQQVVLANQGAITTTVGLLTDILKPAAAQIRAAA